MICLLCKHPRRFAFPRYNQRVPDWQPLVLETDAPLRDVPRDVAERVFASLMAARAERCAALTALAAAHGVSLADAENPPLVLGTWLRDHLAAADAATTSALAADVSLWLGERIVARAPHLAWTMYTAHKKSTGYQRAVLTGFRRVDDPRYYVDLAHFVSAWCDLCARRRAARADFLVTIEATTLRDA